jgi:anti-sigma factor RsiW
MRLFRWWRRPLSCEQVGALLQQFLDGELDDQRTALIAEHLEDCRRCGLEADTYLGIKASLASRADLADDDPVLARLRAFAAEISSRDERP